MAESEEPPFWPPPPGWKPRVTESSEGTEELTVASHPDPDGDEPPFWPPPPGWKPSRARGAPPASKGKKIITVGVIALFGLFSLFAIIGALSDNPDRKSAQSEPGTTTAAVATSDAAPTEEGPPGDNINYRSRIVVRQLRTCQIAVAAVASLLENGAASDLVSLSSSVGDAKDICETARDNVFTADTQHFSDQALDAGGALQAYADGLGKVSNYIDTLTPSEAAGARDDFETAHAMAAQAVGGINQRRAVYGLPPIRE